MTPTGPDERHDETPAGVREIARPASDVERELKGDLPCVRCRYNLRGISVRGSCPECGTPIRVTILARVDPYAPILRPIVLPHITAGGILLWTGGAAAAALLTCVMRAEDFVREVGSSDVAARLIPSHSLASASVFAILASALGALAIVRPHAGMSRRNCLLAAIGVVALIGVACFHMRIQVDFDESHTRPYVNLDQLPLTERSWWRLGQSAMIAACVLLLRPNARLLAARSLLLRMGRVDRQTMLALVAALGVAAVGDVVHLVAHALGSGSMSQVLAMIGTFTIAVGSMLLLVGLIGMVVDSVRVASAVARPPVSMSALLHADGTK
jgi:hypothetical protein